MPACYHEQQKNMNTDCHNEEHKGLVPIPTMSNEISRLL